MSVWKIFRRSVAVEPPPKADHDKGAKQVTPRVEIARPAKPRRGWFGRTFIEPVERLLGRLVRLVVILVGIIVAGIVCLVVISRWMPAPQAVTDSTPVAKVSPQSSAQNVAEKTKDPTRPDKTWVDPYTRKDGTKVKGHWRKN